MDFKYDKKLTYLIAVSGGPDSMALLDMLKKAQYSLIVCHVNYKTRDESDSEEALVRKYCKENNLTIEVATYKDNNNKKQSFEVKARNFRYEFFKEMYLKYNCSGLFVAHHKDDVLETYLLKKQRNVINNSYLINEYSKIKNMKVIRPLLQSFYKDDLLKYCKDNCIEYGIDKTNFMDIHPRNVIRKQLQSLDKDLIYENAIKEEESLIKTKKEVNSFVKYYPVYTIDLLKDKNDMFLALFLHRIISERYKTCVNHSLVLKLKDFINSNKPNLKYLIKNDYYLIKEYQQIGFTIIKNDEYSYTLNELSFFATPYFKLSNNGLKMQGIYLTCEDFPITIRNFKNDDKIKLKSGTKKVSRLFIDKKVPAYKRKMVPIIENCNHEIIFVYGLYRKYGYKYTKNNLFVIQ